MRTLLPVCFDEDLIGSVIVIPAIVFPESGVPVAKVSKAAFQPELLPERTLMPLDLGPDSSRILLLS